jgi:hypothetical protein
LIDLFESVLEEIDSLGDGYFFAGLFGGEFLFYFLSTKSDVERTVLAILDPRHIRAEVHALDIGMVFAAL